MACTSCSLDDVINFIINKYKINRESATSTFYKLRNAVKNKLTCGDYVCNRKILKTFIKNNRLYKFFNNLSNCYLDLIIDNVLESCGIDISEPDPIPGLRLTYLNGEFPETDLVGWNAKFDLPSFGTAFTDMVVNGDEVTLIGGAGITLKTSLFRNDNKLVKIEDDVDCVITVNGGKNAGALSLCSQLTTVTLNGVITTAEEGLFSNSSLSNLSATSCTTMGKNACSNNTSLSTFSLIALVSAGESCFSTSPLMNFFDGVSASVCPLLATVGVNCFGSNTATPAFILIPVTNIPQSVFNNCSCSVISIPSATNLGGTTGNDNVFLNCLNLTTIYCNNLLATIDGGSPDGDLVYAVGTLGAAITYV